MIRFKSTRNSNTPLLAVLRLLPVWLVSLVLIASAHTYAESTQDVEAPSPEKLQQLLAPVALYPDTVLTHLLIAATYPLEVVQADRWAKQHPEHEGQEAVEAAQNEPWDPSVKALLAFPDLLARMSEDLLWTQELGEAFLISESDTLAAVQILRQKALNEGSLEDMEHQEVVYEKEQIIIQPVRREVVYVPYYDSRYVYGSWSWVNYPPVYWSYPPRYNGGFYWGFYAPVGDWFYFGGFHWGQRTVVISYDRPYYYSHHHHYGYRPRYTERWYHNPTHRRGVRYYGGGSRHNYGGGHGRHNPPSHDPRREQATRQLEHHSSRLNAIYGGRGQQSGQHRAGTAQSRANAEMSRLNRERTSGQYNESVRQRVLRDTSSANVRRSSTEEIRANRAPVRPGTQVTRTPERVNRNTPQSVRTPAARVPSNVSRPASTPSTRTSPPAINSAQRSTLQRATNNSRPVSRTPARSTSRSGGDRGGRMR
ncbi:DUF3300 domain-containing protein [Gilvimarinus sp. SDUM040013]|uniref:DUF3300 domain-containing protein n=1 Tax=Gilvimarinus gilvus TaxID=3058038 RepID=A0ABU4RWK0_9GAMM|nr:DUF3300 domain-containing protein [Gilvimarinus sp. SDUM040013]MDO3388497.1 DUF3300 domain-containing protein [Gilvimarinus sp. SDUM040013]MDX6848631.1 DUF3300 domain-containing protein [Gilvimarinus sp. SDUM040013]